MKSRQFGNDSIFFVVLISVLWLLVWYHHTDRNFETSVCQQVRDYKASSQMFLKKDELKCNWKHQCFL